MLAEAIPEPRVTFTLADVREWRPSRPVDLIVSSAVLQWVDGHEQVLRRLAGFLRPGGWLALQVPGNFQAPPTGCCASRPFDGCPTSRTGNDPCWSRQVTSNC